ncbi:MAG: hypothetical protein EA376_13585 [Phycisphaeraceae bacterium]|nr:MAG: hypothetical protein EA376_13585 [Phycisphaeraceae bacterium]
MSDTPNQPGHEEANDDMMENTHHSPRVFGCRDILPPTRDSLTHKFCIAGHEGYLTIGFHPDGAPGEIFIKMAKEGSTISGMCQAFCRAFSLAIQYGLSLEDSVTRFKGMRFDPQGPTTNPDIPEANSIVDYVVRFIELHYCSKSSA